MEYRLMLFCTLAVVVQIISGQCFKTDRQGGGFGRLGNGLSGLGGGKAFGSSFAGKSFGRQASGAGGRFALTSASPVPPTGVSVLTDSLSIEGPLDVGGNLPFQGTVAVEGILTNDGTGSVSYGCGNGQVGITDGLGTGSTPINLVRPTAGWPGLSPSTSFGLVGPGVSSLGPGLNGFGNLGGFLV